MTGCFQKIHLKLQMLVFAKCRMFLYAPKEIITMKMYSQSMEILLQLQPSLTIVDSL